jgi:hypothetical protein
VASTSEPAGPSNSSLQVRTQPLALGEAGAPRSALAHATAAAAHAAASAPATLVILRAAVASFGAKDPVRATRSFAIEGWTAIAQDDGAASPAIRRVRRVFRQRRRRRRRASL